MNSLNELKNWMNIKDNIKIFDRPERGMYSTKDIKKNQVIIKIKSKYILSYNNIYAKHPINNIDEKNSLVAFYLLKLFKENDEWWLPYISSFPNDISEYLYYWSNNNLKLLNNTSIMTNGFYNYKSHMESLEYDWSVIYSYIKENNLFESNTYNNYDELYDLYIKFRILVGSRIFGYKIHDVDDSGMVPYIDMINHSFESNTAWFYDDNIDCFILLATKDILKGMEILDDYGNKSNIDLLLFYGFTLPNNPYSILRVKINNKIYEINSNLIINMNEIIDELDESYPTDTVGTMYLININKEDNFKNKIKYLYDHHINELVKIKDQNIKNIYIDEIFIMKQLIKNII